MPGMDGTGPFGDLNWQCRRAYGFGAGFRGGFGRGRRFGQAFARPVELSKEEQKKVLEAELKQIESEREAIERKLKEIA
ncbi:DUF5320 domain-containing protein [Candidatus Woesearchaeota archaeon]|nr:DUF5320 domain-containing protein [Candidatus Woesearchaeota archaeon]